MKDTLAPRTEDEIKDSFAVNSLNREVLNTTTLWRITYNRIIFIKKGNGSLLIDGEQYPVSDNTIFLIGKGQLFCFDTAVIQGFELYFGDCFWERTPASANNCKAMLFNNIAANQHIPLSLSDMFELETLFKLIYDEFFKAPYINKLDALAAFLKIIMIKIANIKALLKDAFDSYEKQLYRHFLDLVDKQHRSTHTVADYADQLGCHPVT